jgi:hypothetical protein
MPSRKNNKALNRKSNIALTIVVVVFVGIVGAIGFTNLKHRNEQAQGENNLKQAAHDINKIKSKINKLDPQFTLRTDEYCRHDTVELGQGTLRCLSALSINHHVNNEDELQKEITDLNTILDNLEDFSVSSKSQYIPLINQDPRSTSSWGSVEYVHKLTGIGCTADYSIFHFNSREEHERGNINASFFCISEMSKPIYKLKDY